VIVVPMQQIKFILMKPVDSDDPGFFISSLNDVCFTDLEGNLILRKRRPSV
jgi:hypothetical protein